ncbi:WD40 repeat-like protein, partial [Polyporus arcularius HHB13444]
GHETRVEAMDTSLDGRYFATGAADGTVIVWSGATAPERTLVEMQCPAESEGVRSLHFSNTGDFLAGICDDNRTVRVWSTSDGELLWTFRDHEWYTSELVTHVSFSSDGRRLATAAIGGRVRVRLLAMFVRDVPVPSVDGT